MIQTSAEFESVIGRETRTFLARMVFGTFTLSEEIRQITINMGNADGEAFIDGAAYSSHVDISMNISNADITGQEFRLEIGLLLDDNTVEYVPVGIYKAAAADITKTKYTMTVTAWDRMGRKANAAYVPAVLYPCTAGAVLDDITNQTGLVFDTSEFPGIRNIDGLSFPEEYLVSNVIGFIAGLRGGFAYVDYTGTVILAKYPTVSALMVPAARCLDEIALQDDIYTVDAGGEVTAYSYYPGTVRFLGDPRLEPKDMITVVDTLDVSRNVPCMGITATYDGGLTTVVSAPAQAASDRGWGPIQSRVNAALLKAEEAHNEAEATKTTASNAQTAAASAQNTATNAQTAAANAQTAAANALTTANGKNKIFYQDSAPGSGMSVGDIWFDTDGGNAIYEYTANGWVLRQFGNGSIAANSITAVEISVASLSAISANIGTVTAGVLRSADYSYSSGTYTAAGMIVDLNNKVIRTPKTAILSDGSIYSSSVDLTGKITATSGKIGPWTIGTNAIYNTLTSMTDASHDGTYLGTDGIKMVAGSQTVWNALVANSTWSYIESANDVVGIRMVAWPDGSSGLYEYDVPGGNLSALWLRSGNSLSTEFNVWVGSDVDSYVNILKSGTIALSAPTGGKIEFCYDGEIPATASIYESARGHLTVSGVLHGSLVGSLTGHASLDLPLTGGTLTGTIKLAGYDINLGTNSTASNDSGDIAWLYGNGTEKMRIWTDNVYTAKKGPNYRVYDASGTALYSGQLVITDGTGASGKWGINITGHADGDLALTGGTLTGNITFSNENYIIGKVPRKKASGGGWAYAAVRFVGNDDSMFAQFGTHGSDNTLSYIYIGSGTYDARNNLRIYPDGSAKIYTDLTVGGFSDDSSAKSVYLTNSFGSMRLHLSSAGNHGLYSDIKGNWLLYASKDANSTDSNLYVPRPLYCSTGRIYANLASGEAEVVASNGTHRIYMYSNSDGRSGIYGFKADGTAYNVISIANGATTASFNGHATSDLPLTGGTLTGTVILNNSIYMYAKDSGGTARLLAGCTSGDGMVFGYGSKADKVGASYYDGNSVYIRSNSGIAMQCTSASISAALTVTGTITGYDYSGSSHVMVGSAADASHRVGYLYHQNPTTVRVYGQAGGSGYTTYTTLTGTSSSDIRLKRNVADTEIANALSVINQIEMRSFDWLPGWRDYDHQPIGMIADQIEKLDYRLVIGGGNDPDGEPNYKVIDDHYLACYLTKGVQELCDRIEMLEHEIKKLKGAA